MSEGTLLMEDDPVSSSQGGRTFAEVLKEARAARQLTMDQLAEMAGISTAYISLLERGLRGTERPSRERVLRLAEALSASKTVFLEAAGLPVSEAGQQADPLEHEINVAPLLREEQKQILLGMYRQMIGKR